MCDPPIKTIKIKTKSMHDLNGYILVTFWSMRPHLIPLFSGTAITILSYK